MYALTGFGLSVYNPEAPVTPTPPPQPPVIPVPSTAVLPPSDGWWSAQPPVVRYGILGAGAFLIIGAIVFATKK